MNSESTLYSRLGGYDAIAAMAKSLLSKLKSDELLMRFWINRGDGGLAREQQLLIDYLSANTDGPMVYTGRDMLTTHKGMGITTNDWHNFTEHLLTTLQEFDVPDSESEMVADFIESKKSSVVD